MKSARICVAVALSVSLFAAAPSAMAGAYTEASAACKAALGEQFSPESIRYKMQKAKKSGRLATLQYRVMPKANVDADGRYKAMCKARRDQLVALDITPLAPRDGGRVIIGFDRMVQLFGR